MRINWTIHSFYNHTLYILSSTPCIVNVLSHYWLPHQFDKDEDHIKETSTNSMPVFYKDGKKLRMIYVLIVIQTMIQSFGMFHFYFQWAVLFRIFTIGWLAVNLFGVWKNQQRFTTLNKLRFPKLFLFRLLLPIPMYEPYWIPVGKYIAQVRHPILAVIYIKKRYLSSSCPVISNCSHLIFDLI